MIYVLRVLNAIFRPKTAARRIQCHHPDERSELIDLGRDKRFWCTDCGYVGFTGPARAS